MQLAWPPVLCACRVVLGGCVQWGEGGLLFSSPLASCHLPLWISSSDLSLSLAALRLLLRCCSHLPLSSSSEGGKGGLADLGGEGER